MTPIGKGIFLFLVASIGILIGVSLSHSDKPEVPNDIKIENIEKVYMQDPNTFIFLIPDRTGFVMKSDTDLFGNVMKKYTIYDTVPVDKKIAVICDCSHFVKNIRLYVHNLDEINNDVKWRHGKNNTGSTVTIE
jgi:hypothetical protein